MSYLVKAVNIIGEEGLNVVSGFLYDLDGGVAFIISNNRETADYNFLRNIMQFSEEESKNSDELAEFADKEAYITKARLYYRGQLPPEGSDDASDLQRVGYIVTKGADTGVPMFNEQKDRSGMTRYYGFLNKFNTIDLELVPFGEEPILFKDGWTTIDFDHMFTIMRDNGFVKKDVYDW